MKAVELFKNLGYEMTRNDDDDYIIYEKELKDGATKVITFSDQLRNFSISFEGDILIRQAPNINMEMFKAIQKQLEELEWI